MKNKPFPGESCEDWMKRIRNRKGTKNKMLQTVTIREIWERSSLNQKIPFKQYKEVVLEMGKAMRSMLCVGHEVPIPKFGYLTVLQYKPEITKKDSLFSENGRLVDYRSVNFVQAMQNQYLEYNGEQTGDTALHSSGVNVCIGLRRRGLLPKSKLLRFVSQKYVTREIKNKLFGYNYIINA